MIKELRKTNKELEEALKKREEFLKEKPELIEFQEVIDKTLAGAGKNIQNREAALRKLIRETLNELLEKNAELREVIKKIERR